MHLNSIPEATIVYAETISFFVLSPWNPWPPLAISLPPRSSTFKLQLSPDVMTPFATQLHNSNSIKLRPGSYRVNYIYVFLIPGNINPINCHPHNSSGTSLRKLAYTTHDSWRVLVAGSLTYILHLWAPHSIILRGTAAQ